MTQIYVLTLLETQKSGYLVLFEYFCRQTSPQDMRLSSFSGWPQTSAGSVLGKASSISDEWILRQQAAVSDPSPQCGREVSQAMESQHFLVPRGQGSHFV